MKITNFEDTGLNRICEFLINKNIKKIEEEALREILKTINISFVLEGIDRVMSTLICELKLSYVQQSQRYVSVVSDAMNIPELSYEDDEIAKNLILRSTKLYEKMSLLKEEGLKGRPKSENYVYNIPIEDARYILPLAAKTNISVAMTGDKLLDFYYLINDSRYFNLFSNLRVEFKRVIPESIINLMGENKSLKDLDLVLEFYKEDFKGPLPKEAIIYRSGFKNLDLKAGLGAVTSTGKNPPSVNLENWGEKASIKTQGICERVLGYGHESIAEQSRTTFLMICSLVTYHQQIRHRLSSNHREELKDIILDINREVTIPNSIKESIFYEEIIKLIKDFKTFRRDVLYKYGEDKALPFLLNCDRIQFLISTNARIDTQMLQERICMNAQWEIRDISTAKLQKLREMSKVLYEGAMPSCVKGKCKEGKLTCGKADIVRQKYLKN